ncbi:carbohydrate-binding domain-containing protein [Treponema sp.]|uniref:carbohydrate-binding domain-containing protein n=1 Tax=Treponema sp. TaxID=166 RepID=UPI00388EC398
MKKFIALFTGMLMLAGCAQKKSEKLSIDAKSAKDNYATEISISPMDFVKISGNLITISPKEEDSVYTISGYFNGQIMVMKKNTVLKLENAYLENTSGKAAIKCEAKTEVSSAKGSINYIVSRGRGFAKNAALHSDKDLVLGGSGLMFIQGNVCHAVEADNFKIKGAGTFFLEGTKRGSALTCSSLTVEKEKTFSAYFLNSKNGIKADKKILVNSGNFYLYDNDCAFKAKSANFVKGDFFTYGNKTLFDVESGETRNTDAVFTEVTES